MTLAELRSKLRKSVGDARGDVFTPVDVDEFINDAVAFILAEIDGCGRSFDVASDPFIINLAAGVREFTVGVVTGVKAVRTLVDVVRTDLETALHYKLVNFGQRDQGVNDPWLAVMGYGDGHAYAYRAGAGQYAGSWRVGFVTSNPPAQTVAVWLTGLPPPLAGDADQPKGIPDEHHPVIVWRAAVVALTTLNRETGGFVALYQEGMAKLLGQVDRGPTPTKTRVRG